MWPGFGNSLSNNRYTRSLYTIFYDFFWTYVVLYCCYYATLFQTNRENVPGLRGLTGTAKGVATSVVVL